MRPSSNNFGQLLHCSNESDWWEAVVVASGEMGAIPRNYVILDNDDKESQTYEDFLLLFFLVSGSPRGLGEIKGADFSFFASG